jgi:hypothetical protein
MPITNKRFNKDFKKKRINHSRHIKTEQIKKDAQKEEERIKDYTLIELDDNDLKAWEEDNTL